MWPVPFLIHLISKLDKYISKKCIYSFLKSYTFFHVLLQGKHFDLNFKIDFVVIFAVNMMPTMVLYLSCWTYSLSPFIAGIHMHWKKSS
jgi:hypothetical protein